MPGVTPLGLRYPYQNETVNAASWLNLANDIDALMTVTKGLRDKAFRTQTASVVNQGSSSLAVNTASGATGTMLYNKVNWDTNGLVNLGVNNDRITIGPGVWFVRFGIALLSSVTTVTVARVIIADTGGGVQYSNSQMDTFPGTNVGGINTTGIIVNTAAALGVVGLVTWTGTGGPGQWASSTAGLQVVRIREIGNV